MFRGDMMKLRGMIRKKTTMRKKKREKHYGNHRVNMDLSGWLGKDGKQRSTHS